MKFIQHIEKLEGKTIKTARLVDCAERIALVFTDDTCAVFEKKLYGDSVYLELAGEAEAYIKLEAGIISTDEYDVIKEEERKSEQALQRKRELRLLSELQEKYKIDAGG